MNPMKMKTIGLLLIFLTQILYAQLPDSDGYEQVLEIAREDYRNQAYANSIGQLETILPYLKGSELVDAHIFLAFNYVRLGDTTTAVEHFKDALTTDPKLQLKPYDPSPEIVIVYEQAKQEKAHELAGCSCFIPGIGQILRGDTESGGVIIAASTISLAGTLLSWSIADGKRSNYLSIGPADLDRIEEAYDEYNRWRKITVISATVFVGIYLYSIVDAMIVRSDSKLSNAEDETGMILELNGDQVNIGYVFRL